VECRFKGGEPAEEKGGRESREVQFEDCFVDIQLEYRGKAGNRGGEADEGRRKEEGMFP